MKTLRTVLPAVVLFIGLTGVNATAEQASMTVQAQVGSVCLFDTMGLLDFGTVNQGDVVQATNQIKWTCSTGTNWVITDEANFGVEDGSYSGTMSDGGGANSLPFSLTYAPTSGTSTGVQDSTTVTGDMSVPMGQAQGSYSENVTFRIDP